MDLSRQCGGMWIDQDGGDVDRIHRHDELYCGECDGHFCEVHYNEKFNICYDCAGDDTPGAWDL